MKNVTRIISLALCGALALSSCNKKVHTPDPQDQKTPIGFTAVSQTSTVKSETKATTSLSEFHQDFGVWGIARKDSHNDYILWEESTMSKVQRENSTSDTYIPQEQAYWFSGYTYNFIAVAPYTNGVEGLAMMKPSGYTEDVLKFTYDMSAKYEAIKTTPEYDGVKYYKYENPAYGFDLMGAADKTVVEATKPESQQLEFSHLLAKVDISLAFSGAKDASGLPASVTIDRMCVKDVDTKGDYTLTLYSNNLLSVECTDTSSPMDISFYGTTGEGRLNIIPQDSNLILELDFTIGTGENAISTTGFKVDMSQAASNPGEYVYNGWYVWDITITPKTIIFNVRVENWEDGYNFEHPIQ